MFRRYSSRLLGPCLSGLILATSMLPLAAQTEANADTHSKYEVIRFTSNAAWNVNTWILNSETGLVLIDGQMLRSDVQRLAAMLKSLDKPLAAVIVTHPHPDHFLGLSELRRQMGDFEVIGGQVASSEFAKARDLFGSWAEQGLGDEYLGEVVPLTQALAKTQTVQLAGMNLTIDLLGAGESAENLVVYEARRNFMFTGDVSTHGCHLYVGEGRSAAMIAQLNHLRSAYPDTVQIYPGHGDPGRLSGIEAQIAYIRSMQQAFAELREDPTNLTEDGARLSDEARAEFAANLVPRYPALCDYGMPPDQLMSMNVAGLEQEYVPQPEAE